MNDDATLVELARSGDQAAFAELYERYFDRVYDFLARMVRDGAEAADLTQDTFLRAMNSLGSLTKGASFKSWLFTIARNTALNRLERASRTQPLEDTNDAGEEQRFDVIDGDRFGNPEEAAEAAGYAAVVWEAAAALDPKHRSVLLLNLREGLESAEIAEVMGVTRNHAYVLVNRMKAALESAVGALALFRAGRQHCAELDAVLNRLQVAEMSPETRRAIERHATSCEVCNEQRRRLASPFAIFAGMTLIKPPAGLRESIFENLQQASSALSPSPAGTGDGTALPGGGAPYTDGNGGRPPGDGIGAVPGAGHPWRKRPAVMAGAAAAVLFLILAPIGAITILGAGDGSPVEMALVEATQTPVPVAPVAQASPTPVTAQTLSATPTTVPTAEPEDAATAEDQAGPTATPAPPTEVPATAAPPTTEQGLDPTPDAGGPPAGNTPDLAPPATATPPPTPCAFAMTAGPAELVFDAETVSRTVTLQGEGCGAPLAFTAETGVSWIVVGPPSGHIPIGGTATLTVLVDYEDRRADTGRIVITSAAGTLEILVTVEPPERQPASPTPTPTATPDGRTPGSGNGNDDPDECSSLFCPTPTPSTPSGPPNFTS